MTQKARSRGPPLGVRVCAALFALYSTGERYCTVAVIAIIAGLVRVVLVYFLRRGFCEARLRRFLLTVLYSAACFVACFVTALFMRTGYYCITINSTVRTRSKEKKRRKKKMENDSLTAARGNIVLLA